MTDSNVRAKARRKDRHCPEKAFALREASMRTRLLLLALVEAEVETDLAVKLWASRLALEKSREVTAVLRRVITVLERCNERETASSADNAASDLPDGTAH